MNDSLRFARKMLDLAARNKSDVFELNAHMAAGCAVFYQGHAQSTHEHLEQALRHYDAEYHRKTPSLFGWDPGVLSLSYDAQALVYGIPSPSGAFRQASPHLSKKATKPV